jgi:hypothetical protein
MFDVSSPMGFMKGFEGVENVQVFTTSPNSQSSTNKSIWSMLPKARIPSGDTALDAALD